MSNIVNLQSSSVPPSGGSLEIGNIREVRMFTEEEILRVPPSGGSLEIGNDRYRHDVPPRKAKFPLRGDP